MSAPSKRHVFRPFSRTNQRQETYCGSTPQDYTVRWDDGLQTWVETCCGRPALPGSVCRVCAQLATRWMEARRRAA